MGYFLYFFLLFISASMVSFFLYRLSGLLLRNLFSDYVCMCVLRARGTFLLVVNKFLLVFLNFCGFCFFLSFLS